MKAFPVASKTLPISKSLLLLLCIIAFILPAIDFMSALLGLESVSAYATGALVNPHL
jgi:ABC-type maltose transport system permease subunit